MARIDGGAIVLDARIDGADFTRDAKRLSGAARELDIAVRRAGEALRASAGRFGRAAEESVRATRLLRTQALAALGDSAAAWKAAAEKLDGLDYAMRGLRESTRLAFGPMLTLAAPALTGLTQLLSGAILKAGMFAAALTGQDAFARATENQRRYAASLGRSSGAARKLERQLASFDRLDILRADRGGSGGGGAELAGLVDGEALFQIIPIDAGIRDFVDRISELFAQGDYEGVGRALADGLNGALEKVGRLIEWENVGEAVSRGVDGICGIFNGLVDGVDWDLAGRTFGSGVDTLVRAANRLMSGLRLDDLGKALGTALSGAVAQVDFEQLGELIGRLLTAKLTVVANAVASFDWRQFGGKLAEGLGGLLGAMGEALDGIDWAGIAGNLTDGLNRFIARVDWDGAGGFLGRRFNDALDVLRTAATRFDWGKAGKSFSKAVNGLVKTVDWTGLGQLLDRLLNGALDFALSFVNGFDADSLATGISKALEQVDWNALAGKLWQLLATALKKLGSIGQALFGASPTAPAAKLRAAVEFVTGAGKGYVSPLEGLKQLLAPGASVGVRLEKQGWSSIAQYVGTAVTVLTTLVKSNWSTLAGFVGDRMTALVNLARGNYTSLGDFVGNGISAAVSLVKSGWSTLSGFVGDGVSVRTSLQKWGWSSLEAFIGQYATIKTQLEKWGWSSLSSFVGDSVSVRTALQKWGWSTIQAFVGDSATVRTSLQKWGWSTLEGFIGQYATIRTSLMKWGWDSIEGFIGQYASVRTSLERWGWSTIQAFVGDSVSVWTSLEKWGWSSIAGFVGDAVSVWTSLEKSGWTSLQDWIGSSITAKVNLVAGKVQSFTKTIADGISTAVNGVLALFGKAGGGIITPGGRSLAFAAGGAISGGRASWWGGVRRYAAGTRRAHGTLFVAGEAGPEVVGHVNGRTEILNKSQLAQAMRGAVASGMAQAVNALGRYLAGHMSRCANALIGATLANRAGNAGLLARLSAVAERVSYAPPVMAGGTVAPYEADTYRERRDAGLRDALDANNEDLIRTIISVIGAQTGAIVAALRDVERSAGGGGGLSAQQLINEINRRTQMFGASPLKGV